MRVYHSTLLFLFNLFHFSSRCAFILILFLSTGSIAQCFHAKFTVDLSSLLIWSGISINIFLLRINFYFQIKKLKKKKKIFVLYYFLHGIFPINLSTSSFSNQPCFMEWLSHGYSTGSLCAL